MSYAGNKIIAGLREAVAGNFARVTIDGQTWVRQDAGSPDDQLAKAMSKIAELTTEIDCLRARMTIYEREVEDNYAELERQDTKIHGLKKRLLAAVLRETTEPDNAGKSREASGCVGMHRAEPAESQESNDFSPKPVENHRFSTEISEIPSDYSKINEKSPDFAKEPDNKSARVEASAASRQGGEA